MNPEKRFPWPHPTRQQASPRWLVLGSVSLVFLMILIPRLVELSRFVTPDEPLWLYRSANFYYALGQRNFANTSQSEHPGVTTMWAGMLGFLVRYPEYRGSGAGQFISGEFERFLREVAQVPALEILLPARVFMILANSLALSIAFLYAWRLMGYWIALLGFVLIAFSPFHISQTRILHLDGLLGSLMLLSVLAFAYHLAFQGWSSLLISGLAAGLSWLTKSPGFALIPIIFLLGLYTIWWHAREKEGSDLRREAWQLIKIGLFWLVIAGLIFVLSWPAMWVTPFESLSRIFSNALDHIEYGHGSAVFFNGQIFPDGRLDLSYSYFYPLTFLWRTTPMALFGLVFGLILLVWQYLPQAKSFSQTAGTQSQLKLAVVSLLLMSLIFTVGITLSAKKFDRYFLPVYLPLNLLAAVGWIGLANQIKSALSDRIAAWMLPSLVLFLAVLNALWVLIPSYPYYLTYYNPLLGGLPKAREVMQVGWGEGLDEAARYLEAKQDSYKLNAISWYSRGSMTYYFDGRVENFPPDLQNLEELDSYDYAVIYISQIQRQIPQTVIEYLQDFEPEHIIRLSGIDYAWIYPLGNDE